MDSITRNEIFLENEGMIWRVIRRNWPLIRALRLDQDDVYQELAMAALDAIDTFDPMRSECIQAHIWMKMQYAVLDIKRRYRPCGLTSFDKQRRPVVVSLDQEEGLERLLAVEFQDEVPGLSPQMRQALSRLNAEERKAVISYLNDEGTKRETAVKSALNKIKHYYLVGVSEPRYTVQIW